MSKRIPRQLILAACAALPTTLLIGSRAAAAVVTWNNGATNFNDNGSWTGGAPGASDIATFDVAAVTQPQLTGDITVSGLNFSAAAASGYNISSAGSQVLTLLSTTTTTGNAALSAANTASTNTIAAGIKLGAAAGSTQVFTTSATTTTLAITGVISGGDPTSTLRLAGSGVYEFRNAANTFAGNIDQTAGNTLAVAGPGSLGNSNNVLTINSSTARFRALNAMTVSNNIELFTSWGVDATSPVEFTGNIDLNGATRSITAGAGTATAAPTFSGVISDSSLSTAGLSFSRNASSDIVNLTGVNNSYAGPTTFSNVIGRIVKMGMAGQNSSIGQNVGLSIGSGGNQSSGLWYIGAGESSDKKIYGISGSASISIDTTGATGALTLTGDMVFTGVSKSLTVRGDQPNSIVNRITGIIPDSTLAGGILSISKTGTGTWQLDADNAFTGTLAVSGGMLVLGQAASAGDAAGKFISFTAGTTLATLFAPDATFLSKFVATVNQTNGVLAIGASTSGIDVAAAGIHASSTMSIGSYGDVTLSGTYTPNGTAYRLGGGFGNLTVDSALTGTNTLTVTGGNRVILQGANTFSGATTLNTNAILQGRDTTATRSGDGVTVSGAFGTSTLNIATTAATATLELRANGESDGTVQNLIFNNNVQASVAGTTFNINVDRASGAGTNKVLAVNLINMQTANDATLATLATVNVTGANGYSLRTRNGTALTLGGAFSGGMLLNPTSANLIIDGVVSNSSTTASTKTLILGGTSSGNRITGAIQNAAAADRLTTVVKQNASTWALNGASTYTGGTTVSAGTLMVNGIGTASTSSGTGVGSVQITGGRLGGTGRIIGNTTVSSGATLLAGDGVNANENLELTSDLNLLDGSRIGLVLGSTLSHSTLTRTGTGNWAFDSDQAFVITLAGTPAVSDVYDNVIAGLAGDPGTALWTTIGTPVTGTFTYDNAGGVDFTVTGVPEPTSIGLIALAGAGLLARRRRRA